MRLESILFDTALFFTLLYHSVSNAVYVPFSGFVLGLAVTGLICTLWLDLIILKDMIL
jgi:hypothetical protein